MRVGYVFKSNRIGVETLYLNVKRPGSPPEVQIEPYRG